MKPQSRVMSISRPLTFAIVLAISMVEIGRNKAEMALLAVALGFFVASSAVCVGWIPAPRRWVEGVWWAEVLMAAVVNGVVGRRLTGGAVSILFYPIAVSLSLVLERSSWLPATIALWCGWVFTSIPLWNALPRTEALMLAVIYGLLLAFVIRVGRLIRNLADEKERSEALIKELAASRASLERAHRQLQATLAQEQEMAVVSERQRLAREIHDGVAHALTALVVQIQAGRRLMDVDPVQARTVIDRCEEMAREALQETRRAVRALHPSGLEQQSDVLALRRLARDFGIATGIEVTVDADDSALQVTPDPRRLEQLYRIFQEALTNAHRHGQARHVTANLSVDGGTLRMIISNDGLPPARLDPGVGLKSMRERAQSIGGTFEILPGVHGLTIAVTVPLHQEEAG